MATSTYDSLVIGEAIELIGPPGGIASVNPMCPGAVFLVLPPLSLDAPQPTTDFIASLIVDGEKPFGDRASDRTITLSVLIKAPDYRTLAGARELLLKTIDQPHWPLTWTRASGADPGTLPMVLDCFRAQPSVIPMGDPTDHRPPGRAQVQAQVDVKFQALPYGRSDTQQQVAFAAPIAGLNSPGTPPAPVVLDAFTTINSPQCQQSAQHVVGPNSCFWDPGFAPFSTDDGQNCPLAYGAALAAPVSLSGMTGLSMWLGLGSRHFFNHHPRGLTRVTMSFSLTDSSNTVLSWSEKSRWLPVSADPQVPVFTRVTARIPQNSAAFNYASVKAYSVTIVNRAPRFDTQGGELRWTVAYLDALTAYSSSNLIASPSPRGSVYTLHGVVGTHRAPVSVQFQSAPSAGTPTTVTATGGGTYTVPANTVYLKVEAAGGGGAGASQTVSGLGGGGGGAEYAAELNFAATPAVVIPYVVGTGDTAGAGATSGRPTTFGPAPGATLTVTAHGGQSAAQNSATGGAGGTGSTNSVHFDGGAGRTASGAFGGGGGSSGGSASAGNTPLGTGSTSFTTAGTTSFVAPLTGFVFAEVWGGGGGGGTGPGPGTSPAQAGSGGEYAAQNIAVTQGNSYAVVVGAAGAGGTGGSGRNGSNGGLSSFTGDTQTVTAHGGLGGPASWSTSGPAGGSGSANAKHFNGGAGGSAQPYGGGGGSSASPSGPGNSGDGYGNPGAAPTDGGGGGRGPGPNSNPGANGTAPGGGGSATYTGTTAGNGAAGKVRLSYAGGTPDQFGAPAVTGGGAGGNGGATANSAGSAGSQPGGGGGGADSAGTAEAGGGGGNGKLIITPYSSAAFPTLIVHRPGKQAPLSLNPFVPVGAGLVAPGATEYTVPSLVSGQNADFNGTYTVILTNFSFNSSSSPRTISVTVRQYEAPSGAHYDSATVPITITPSTQVTNGIVIAGTLTLPLKAVADDNTSGFYTVLVSDSNSSDRWYDCLFLDVQGQTVIINQPGTGYINYYLDEPDPRYDLGNYLGSQSGRPGAVSVMGAAPAFIASGGPLTIEPGINTLMAYSQSGAPSIALSYWSRWFSERLE